MIPEKGRKSSGGRQRGRDEGREIPRSVSTPVTQAHAPAAGRPPKVQSGVPLHPTPRPAPKVVLLVTRELFFQTPRHRFLPLTGLCCTCRPSASVPRSDILEVLSRGHQETSRPLFPQSTLIFFYSVFKNHFIIVVKYTQRKIYHWNSLKYTIQWH